MKKYPHVNAAFINAIAEEGTKAEAIEFLQEQWNETRYQTIQIRKLNKRIEELTRELDNRNQACATGGGY